MLKSSNLNSVMNELTDEETLRPDPLIDDGRQTKAAGQLISGTPLTNSKLYLQSPTNESQYSLAVLQMSAGILNIAAPPLSRARGHLKDLISKQNKIYIDLSKEKYKLDCSEVTKLNDMMNDVKFYKEKLSRIKKEMQNIYQRTKVLKKRATNVAACKQREYQRKLEKQHLEESLIASQQS